MSFFTVAQMDALRATTVRIATLVDLEFAAAPAYLWNGFGDLAASAHLYKGLGDLGSISGIAESRGAQSRQVTLTLSGVNDQILGHVLTETEAVQGRLAVLSAQLFDADEAPIGEPWPYYFGVMQAPRVTRTEASDTEGPTRSISIPTENLFAGRHRPPAGRYTDREQQIRYPGDLFCSYVAALVSQQITWPDY